MRHALAALAAMLVLAGCRHEPPLRVALDVPDIIARTLLREFGQAEDLEIDVQPSTARGPCSDCDVVWSKDPATAMALNLAPLPERDYGRPASMIGPERRWIATSAVARVIVYNPDKVSEDEAPTSVTQLDRPNVAQRLVMADPTRGAAAWYAAALFTALGEKRAAALYHDIAANGAHIVADEDAVVAALLAGERAIALTDNDRAFAAQSKQPTLVVSVPDQAEGGLGAFLLPAVVGITPRGIDRPASRRLVEFLLSPSATRRISLTDDSILVLSDPGEVPAGLLSILKLRVMPAAYAALAARLPGLPGALAQAN